MHSISVKHSTAAWSTVNTLDTWTVTSELRIVNLKVVDKSREKMLMFPMFSGPLLDIKLSLFSDVPFLKEKYSNMYETWTGGCQV